MRLRMLVQLGVGVATVVCLMLAAPAAHAANLVPNPGFETDCSGVPCQWSAAAGSTISRDTTIKRSPSAASLKVTSAAILNSPASAFSDCFAVTPGTTYGLSGWYLNSSPSVTRIEVYATYTSLPGCIGSVFSPLGAFTTTPASDGDWHQLTALSVAPNGSPFVAVSARIVVTFSCSTDPCPNTVFVNFDDLSYDDVLAVQLSSFTGVRSHRGVLLRWRTGAEVNTLGFNVYRQRAGARRVRLNRRIIPALSLTRGTLGGAYSYRDRRAPRKTVVRYWLQEVAANGSRTWHGPVRIRIA
jgi:hypothetical protein